MPIFWNEEQKEFHLTNGIVSYIMALLPDSSPGFIYFGRALDPSRSYAYLQYLEGRGASTQPEGMPAEYCLDFTCREYPSAFRGDFRTAAIGARAKDGKPLALDLCYRDHRILDTKPEIPGQPSCYTESNGEAETLLIQLKDEYSGLEVDLYYTIYSAAPVLCRHTCIRNRGPDTLVLERAMSSVLDLDDDEWDFIQFSGSWARERHEYRSRLRPGSQAVSSSRGMSSHQHNPAVLLARPDATETAGEVYAAVLIYSGNFEIGADVGSHGHCRLYSGINPESFSWELKSGAEFYTPESVTAYSSQGFEQISLTFHRLFRERLARGYWRDRERPVLLNNWEATYFDFDEAKLLAIASESKALGVELFVLDDGWFGKRNDDTSSLGDWFVNTKKLPDGIDGLARKIEALGLRFGLWIEPEMVNPDSRLFEQHPDWAVGPLGNKRTLARNQYVLDLSRQEIVDYLFKTISSLLGSAPVSYVKWDMNRNLTEPVSACLPPERQGEFFHRYILGFYELYRRLTEAFPKILFESCASGGGRFDGATLAFAPQAWTSDNTDAVERLAIQWGSSYMYPLSSTGAHVSDVPNHQVGRITPLWTRAFVAYFGAFGYELDPLKLSIEDREAIKRQIVFYKKWRAVFQFGNFYRLKGGLQDNEYAWMTVSADKQKAVVLRVQILSRPNSRSSRLRLRGLDADQDYQVQVLPSVQLKDDASIRLNSGSRTGAELMHAGLICGGDGWASAGRGDFASWLFTLEADNES